MRKQKLDKSTRPSPSYESLVNSLFWANQMLDEYRKSNAFYHDYCMTLLSGQHPSPKQNDSLSLLSPAFQNFLRPKTNPEDDIHPVSDLKKTKKAEVNAGKSTVKGKMINLICIDPGDGLGLEYLARYTSMGMALIDGELCYELKNWDGEDNFKKIERFHVCEDTPIVKKKGRPKK